MSTINYNKFIQNILDARGRFNCREGYHERHHIIPKCMGGDNSLENLIDLYAREHFIAHQLLSEENPQNSKLVSAWWRMCNMDNKSKEIYQMSPEEYEEARIKFAETASSRIKGENNPNYGKASWNKGKHMSEESRKKMREACKGKYVGENNPMYGKPSANRGKHTTEEVKRKQSEAAKASWTEERRKKQSGENHPMFGKNHTQDTKDKIGEAIHNTWTDERRKQQSEELKANRRGENHPMWGKHLSEETRRKISQAKIGTQLGDENPNAKKVIRLSDGKTYTCGKCAAEENNIKYQTFKVKCTKHDGFMYYDEQIKLQSSLEEN